MKVRKEYEEEGTTLRKGSQVRKDEIQPSPRKAPDNHAVACGNGSSAETDSENKRLSTLSLKISSWEQNNISQSGRNLHTHICSQHLTCVVQTPQPDWKCKIITGCSQGVCPCVPSHACFHHTAQAAAKTQLESPAGQQDPKIQGSLVELRPRC